MTDKASPNRAAVLLGAREVHLQDVPVPDIRVGDVLVRISAVGICGSDVHYYRDGRIANNEVRKPVILGHESAGTIVTASADQPQLQPGTRVAIEPQRPCGHCRWCVTGAYNMCPDMQFFADPPTNGALTQLVAAPAKFCHPVPDELTDDEAALIEPLAVALWAALRARVTAGDAVLVSGAGPIGILAAQVAVALGAGRVVVADVNVARLQFVSQFGVDTLNLTETEYTPELSIDVLIECSGAPGSIRAAAVTMNPRGRIAAVGIGRSPLTEIDLLHLQSRELELIGVYRYAGIYPRAIALVARGAIDLRSLVTHRFDLEHTADALELSHRDPASIKAIVYPGRQP